MKYLKLYEAFDKGIEEWDSNWQTRNQITRQTHGTDFFTKRELDFFRQFFVKTERDDFFRVSGEKVSGKAPDGTTLSGERRSTFKARYMPGDNQINPISISITRLKDDYFMVEISCLNKEESRFSEYTIGNTPRSKVYLVDTFEDLKYFLSNIRKYWKKINDSWRPTKESHIKESLNYKSDLWTQIDTIEKQRKLSESHIRFDQNEFEKLNQFVESLGHNFKTKEENYLTSNLFIILNPVKSRSKLDLCVYKLQDDWYIVSFETSDQRSSYSVNFLCDQLDAVHELIKISTSTGDIKVPFDYFELTSRVSYPQDVNKTSNSLLCAELIRQKIQEYNFQIEYDEILPKTRGSNSIRFWKAVEFSDLSKEAIEFFNVRIEQGRRVIMIRISFQEYTNNFFLVHFALGPELSMKHRSFECQGLEGVRKLFDDKFSQLGKAGTTIKQGQLDL